MRPGRFVQVLGLAVVTGIPSGIAGAIIARLSAGYGGLGAGRNNLILDQIHDPRDAGVPLRLFRFILSTAVIAHLFGGSTGREGAPVLMGGSTAGAIARFLRPGRVETRVALMCGIGGVFLDR